MFDNKRGHIAYGDNSCQQDETPDPKRHQQFEPRSYAFLEEQQTYSAIRQEIEREFRGEEERQFRKKLTSTVKKEMRREAALDLEEANRLELQREEARLESRFIRDKGKEMQDMKDALLMERSKTKDLEARLKASEKRLDELLKERAVDGETFEVQD